MQRYRARVVALFLVLFIAVGCTPSGYNPATGGDSSVGYTWEQERQIGAESDAAIVAQYGIYNDPQTTAYVNRIGERVLANSDMRAPDTPAKFRNTPFTFRVLDSPVVNAFALPGGYVYVTRGLMSHLDNEAQLAVVLGHEIGHVAARHSSRQVAKQQRGQIGLIAGAILGGAVLGGGATESILNLGGQSLGLLFLKYGRDAEREADREGVEYSEQSGYKASEGSEFFRSLKRLSAQSGGGLPNFLSTHPDPGEREQKIRELAAEYGNRGTEVNEQQYLNQLNNMPLGEDPRQGFTENGMFYHPELRFQFRYPQGLARSKLVAGRADRGPRAGRGAPVHHSPGFLGTGGRAAV